MLFGCLKVTSGQKLNDRLTIMLIAAFYFHDFQPKDLHNEHDPCNEVESLYPAEQH